MTHRQCVLVVDGLPETEEVLKAVFEPRGLQVHGVSSSEADRNSQPPSLMVLHDETPRGSSQLKDWKSVPRVIIGTTGLREQDTTFGDRQFLRQPFQYRELIQAVEQLLSESPPVSV